MVETAGIADECERASTVDHMGPSGQANRIFATLMDIQIGRPITA